jgi:hypothetical protein
MTLCGGSASYQKKKPPATNGKITGVEEVFTITTSSTSEAK